MVDNKMANEKRKTMIYSQKKDLQRKLKIEEHKPQ